MRELAPETNRCRPQNATFISLGHSISYRQIHMPSSFSGWNRRTGTSVSPDGLVTMRRRSATTTAVPLGVLLQTMPLISVSCEPRDDSPGADDHGGAPIYCVRRFGKRLFQLRWF